MSQEKQDIRITKTQRALMTALLELLEQSSFQKITVNDICQKALVSRSTFYVHFEDKYVLLGYCLQQLRLQNDSGAESVPTWERLRLMIAAVYDRRKLYRNLFLADLDHELMQMFLENFSEVMLEVLTSHSPQSDGPDLQIRAVFYANGMAGTIMWWIRKDFPVSSDDLADTLHSLISIALV